jgi:hypothetical protein
MKPLNDVSKEVEHLLGNFAPITLNEMDSVKLMDRIDTKYTFHYAYLPEILQMAQKYYRILEINEVREFRYITSYYDTCDMSMYHQHINGKLNRYKVRQRRYDATGTEFFEIKFKTNKGRTQKSRIENNSNEVINDTTLRFLKKKSPYDGLELHKILNNCFYRVTLVDQSLTERATLDFDLSFSSAGGDKHCPFLAIAEIKQGSKALPSPLIQIMRKLQIRPGGISKYCFGVANTFDQIKTNRIKSQLIKIQNLKYGHDFSC